MKKISIICAALAIVALVSSCNKEENTVTLGVAIDQTSKLYINDHTPTWVEDDEIFINDEYYNIQNPNGGTGYLTGVTEASCYRALYDPYFGSWDGVNLADYPNFPYYLPSEQPYFLDDDIYQYVYMPMGAYTTGNTLLFHNLCSVVRVTVNNLTNSSFTLNEITLTSTHTGLSGGGMAYISGTAEDCIVMGTCQNLSKDGDVPSILSLQSYNHVSLTNISETLLVGGSAYFDIVVPSFVTSDQIDINIVTNEGEWNVYKSNVTVPHNTLVTVTANVDELTPMFY